MTTVDEYVRMAEKAEGENAHVAVVMYLRGAIESTGYAPDAAPILLKAVRYAQGLKKPADRGAIASWSQETAKRIELPGLVELVNQETAELRMDDKNAAAP